MAKSNKDIKKLILNFINLNPLCSSKEIHENLKNDFAYATIKRAIQLLLINNNYCPISFRTVDSIDYKKAMLIFYEQNNISAFKKIFIDQFEFAVKTYF